MRKFLLPIGALLVALVGLSILEVQPAGAQDGTATPEPTEEAPADPEQIARGEYLTTVIGCSECHTPLDPNTFQPVEEMRWAGGQVFPLDPTGSLVVVSKNLTSDKATGIGDWTDEEIKVAITTGIAKDGLHLFPLMPYVYFNNMADADLDAIVAYLRTIKPISNSIERKQVVPADQLPKLERRTGIVAPDPKDTPKYATYLMTALLTCGDCHTPVDPATGLPSQELYFAGGQPFEGPWGLVYGGNITPDEKTGISSWTDDDIRRLIQAGVRNDGRVAIVMPRVYSGLTETDLNALIYYLRNDVPAVENEVPKAALNDAFIITAEAPEPTEEATDAATEVATEAPAATEAATPAPDAGAGGSSTTLVIVAIIAILVVGGGLVFFTRRNPGP
jgi:mono/diheme cytochrome c family protein